VLKTRLKKEENRKDTNCSQLKNWINQRIKSIEVRKELTDEWKRRGMKEGMQFAALTDIITKEWSGRTTKPEKPQKLSVI